MKKTLMFASLLVALLAIAGCQTGSMGSSQDQTISTIPPLVGGNTQGGALNSPAIPNEGLAARIITARRANDALLNQYSWSSRVELIDNGTVEDIRIDLVSFGPGGQLQRTVVNDQSAPLPYGFLRKRIAENEREKVEKYLAGLSQLLDQYTLPTPGKVIDYVSQAQISAPDANGLLKLTGGNVLVSGDTYTLWIDPATRQNRRIQITTSYDQNYVELTATFRTLKSGLTHVQYAEVDVPGKGLRLQMHNFDYNQNN